MNRERTGRQPQIKISDARNPAVQGVIPISPGAALKEIKRTLPDNYIYMRIQNRGTTDAVGVTATAYWSEVATLVTPDSWNIIGATAPVDVPQGDTIVVAGPLTWPAAEIPATGAA